MPHHTTDLTGTTVLVTGATGYVGGHLVPALLDAGARVRVLSRSAEKARREAWGDRVDVVEGDASSGDDLRRAMDGCDVAYYLLHSMDGGNDFVRREREMAQTVAAAAASAGIGRIVYLGGLHPEGVELSDHQRSRAAVGEVLLESPVDAVVLQAGIVLGHGSASFDMLRHLTRRLPVMTAPRWVSNRVQPIAVDDVVHYLVGAAAAPLRVNRALDVGGPEAVRFDELVHRYAAVAGLRRRRIVRVPVLTPRVASLWIGLVTPVDTGVARPLMDSLAHDAVVTDGGAVDEVVPPPPGGPTGLDEALRRAHRDATGGAAHRS